MIDNYEELIFLIDLLNIALINRDRNKAKIENFELVKNILQDKYTRCKIIGIADPSAPYKINNKSIYENYIQKGIISQVGPGEKADYYIIQYAKNHPYCLIISNDAFREYDISEELKNRIIPVTIINNEAIFSKKLVDYLKNEGEIIVNNGDENE